MMELPRRTLRALAFALALLVPVTLPVHSQEPPHRIFILSAYDLSQRLTVVHKVKLDLSFTDPDTGEDVLRSREYLTPFNQGRVIVETDIPAQAQTQGVLTITTPRGSQGFMAVKLSPIAENPTQFNVIINP